MKPISKLRFDLLAGYIRDPQVFLISNELEWYEEGNERLLGIITEDVNDRDFVYVILARDKLKRFRAITLQHSFPSKKKAREALRKELAKRNKDRTDNFYQGDEKGKPVDFFRPVVDNRKLAESFRELSTGGNYPAAEVISEILHYYEDIDGNFLEQFQTTGFDARLWELYLYALLVECGFAFDSSFQAPDFFCIGLPGKFFIEATTVNPSNPSPDLSTMTRQEYYGNYVQIKFGSPLYSKLQKKYWEKEHVKGLPFVLAVQDFHDFQSMSWSSYALPEYLYGVRPFTYRTKEGKTIDLLEEIPEFTTPQKTVPSNFFELPDSENISAVVSNPCGTIAKFNRIGHLAGFGKNIQGITISSLAYGEAGKLRLYINEVDSNYSESWSEGLNVFHNPRAVNPLPESYFPEAAHYHLKKDGLEVKFPPFHPIGSISVIWTKGEIKQSNSDRKLTIKELSDKYDVKFKDG